MCTSNRILKIEAYTYQKYIFLPEQHYVLYYKLSERNPGGVY